MIQHVGGRAHADDLVEARARGLEIGKQKFLRNPPGLEALHSPDECIACAFEQRLRPGARVNLERPLRADGRFDGHIVQGHVDGVGRVGELRRLGASAELVVAPPPELERYLVAKGSVAVDGVSLTIAALAAGCFTVALIPYTLENTTLGATGAGELVNLEADVVAKYVERLVAPSGR